jgi:cytochrome c oxidase cbb3-type subunit 3
MSNIKDELLDHNYDGIQEYDNPLPPWWVNLFYVTMVWATVYLLFFHVLEIGDRSSDEYKKEFDSQWKKENDPQYHRSEWFPAYHDPYYHGDESDLAQRRSVKIAVQPAAEKMVFNFEPLADRANLTKGREVFVKNCVVCHGDAGEGKVGPNLTDDYWIHGAGFNDIMKTIFQGVPEKGMLEWGKLIKKEDIHQVASYIMTLRGTHPANPKAPQGTLVK